MVQQQTSQSVSSLVSPLTDHSMDSPEDDRADIQKHFNRPQLDKAGSAFALRSTHSFQSFGSFMSLEALSEDTEDPLEVAGGMAFPQHTNNECNTPGTSYGESPSSSVTSPPSFLRRRQSIDGANLTYKPAPAVEPETKDSGKGVYRRPSMDNLTIDSTPHLASEVSTPVPLYKRPSLERLYTRRSLSSSSEGASTTSSVIKLGVTNCEFEWSMLVQWVYFSLLQTPWYTIKLFFGIFYVLYLILFKLRAPTDADIINLILSNYLSFLATSIGDGLYELEVKDCKLEISRGKGLPAHPMKNFKFVFTDGTAETGMMQVKLCLINGQETTNRQQMMSILFTYITTSFHTKCHLFSNDLCRHIVKHNISLLYDSTFGSIPLHSGLCDSQFSVTNSREQNPWLLWYAFVTRDSICVHEPLNMTSMENHPQKIEATAHAEKRRSAFTDLRRMSSTSSISTSDSVEKAAVPLTMESVKTYEEYCALRNAGLGLCVNAPVTFLLKSRRVLSMCMRKHDLPMELLEPLFNHTILHASHHYVTWMTVQYKYSNDPLQMMPTSLFEEFNAMLYAYMFTKPTLNPLFPNKIKHSSSPFFKDLYRGLVALDPLIADEITCSIMY